MSSKKIEDNTAISGSFSVNQWKKIRNSLIHDINDTKNTDIKLWEDAYKILTKRIESRFLNPIAWILEKDQNLGEGFSVVAIQCILIEQMEAFYQGKIYTTSKTPKRHEYNSSKKLFCDFLMSHSPFKDYFETPKKANGFYDNIRCGLLHEAATKESSKIRKASESTRIVDFNDSNESNMTIYREHFQSAILKYIESYKKELLSSKTLQLNFVRKFDDLCGIKHAYYFSYGSNMNLSQFESRVGKYHSAEPALIKDYEFVYNKKSKDGSAKANIRRKLDSVVYGVCFEIDYSDFDKLNNFEKGYDRKEVIVSIGEELIEKVITYISISIDDTLSPTSEYKNIIQQGAIEFKIDMDYINKYIL